MIKFKKKSNIYKIGKNDIEVFRNLTDCELIDLGKKLSKHNSFGRVPGLDKHALFLMLSQLRAICTVAKNSNNLVFLRVSTDSGRSELVYPESGAIYETTEDAIVEYRANFFTSHIVEGKAILPKGEGVEVSFFGGKPLNVSAKPLSYKQLEDLIIPQCVRDDPMYKKYDLHITTESINKSYTKK